MAYAFFSVMFFQILLLFKHFLFYRCDNEKHKIKIKSHNCLSCSKARIYIAFQLHIIHPPLSHSLSLTLSLTVSLALLLIRDFQLLVDCPLRLLRQKLSWQQMLAFHFFNFISFFSMRPGIHLCVIYISFFRVWYTHLCCTQPHFQTFK